MKSLRTKFCLLKLTFLLTCTSQNIFGQNTDNINTGKQNVSISLLTNQAIVKAPIKINYTLKSGKIEFKSNTVISSKYGFRIIVLNNIQLTKGSGTIDAIIDGIAPSTPGIYELPINDNKLTGYTSIEVIDPYSQTINEDVNDLVTQISTTDNSFKVRRSFKLELKPGTVALTLQNGQLLGSSDGIEITYAGNIQTYTTGIYQIPIIISGKTGIKSGTYKIPLNYIPGNEIVHKVIINNSKIISSFMCEDINIMVKAGNSFSVKKSVMLTLTDSVLNLSANQLLGESNGIEVRYYGPNRTLYPGDNNLNIVINGGSLIKSATYNIELNSLSNIQSACNITVNISE